MEYLKTPNSRTLNHWISVPFILFPLPFFIITDLAVEIYHRVGFPLCHLPLVVRSEYILIFDRNKLKYLNPLQKLFCMYCGYANGLLRYQKEIAGQTEKYWCGIMHDQIPGFKIPEDQAKRGFAQFGNKQDFENKFLK